MARRHLDRENEDFTPMLHGDVEALIHPQALDYMSAILRKQGLE